MKKIIFLSIIMLFGFTAFAQNEAVIELQSQKGPYLTNRFFDNIFISVAGGANVYWGENDNRGSFWKRVAPALDVSLGKWITPGLGVRLQYSGLRAKGWSYGQQPYSTGSSQNGFYKEKFHTSNLHADLLWNVSNAWGGYREDRFWDFVPYVGFGWAHSSNVTDNGYKKNEIAATAGLLNNMRISPAVDINLELKCMLVNQNFDFVTGGSKAECMSTVTLGLTYKFNRRDFSKASDIVPVSDNSMYINEINDLKGKLAQAQRNRDELANRLAQEQSKEATVVKEMYPVLGDMAIFFRINTAVLTEESIINIGYIADVIKKVPDKKFILYSSADKETGTAAYNQKLSEKRGQAVFDALTKKFGVNPAQLTIQAVGSSEQRFNGAKLNRVVVIEDNE